MNTVFIILSVITTYIGFSECNIATPISAERVSRYCYYCSNCPRPFTSASPWVTQVPSNTGWCAMMSTTSSPDGIYTRGVAQPGLCTSNGCSWKNVGGVTTWVCCCDQDLCNAYVPLTCYYCSTCPRPFTSASPYVTQVVSNTGWCAKMSATSSPDGIYTRGVAQPGLCSFNSCSWMTVSGVTTWVCCCNQGLCNQ
ncbi:unnamed protein product [Rotaria socialis]|uniref:Uncharacterized protein n=1 Tax=Rotaria socialis TaxID=392032 RepID=A0A818TSU7_9BILA|nr:unnamed protein product [Rotaria socialis]CAF3405106.1 unnamed protein product [Rotaria socialis]CAF3567674.1 unnamed protein product [Rotaria socialis]CAF3598715.1 unnamed protein product [Rotaria socialis]CAF3681633.1 unnamed protein product [Rotaria socialis]